MATIIKAYMNSDIPLETVAIFFSSELMYKTGYWLGVCHGRFHLLGITPAMRSVNRELQNEKFLPTVGFKPVPSAYEANMLSIALLDPISIEHLKVNHVLPQFAI